MPVPRMEGFAILSSAKRASAGVGLKKCTAYVRYGKQMIIYRTVPNSLLSVLVQVSTKKQEGFIHKEL